jgi:transcriptional regulator with XRE-family HTH domain
MTHPRSRLLLGEIRAEMARQSMTATRLADLSGIRQPTLSRKLSGDRQVTLPELLALCDALGVPLSVMFARAEQQVAA